MQREFMEYDVLIVGGGPAGLSAAIRLKQLALARSRELSVCLIEKSAEIGGHILSGTVMDPASLDALLPGWRGSGDDDGATSKPVFQGSVPVSEEQLLFLREGASVRIPEWLLPAGFRHHGNLVLSLGSLCRWLAVQAEALGVEIYPGFAGAEILYDDNGAVKGVATGDQGRGKDGQPRPDFQPGMELHAAYTLFAEGARGHLGKQLEMRFDLRREADPQVYGLGIKEVWTVPVGNHQPGRVIHTVGWPLDGQTYGGGFLYHLGEQQVSVGFVTGLAYSNPTLSPFEEFQRFKTHPALRRTLAGGQRLAYGARVIAAGGLQSLPTLVFPGGALIGDEAGFLNAARIKGSHSAITSGSLAAEACFAALAEGRRGDKLRDYPRAFAGSALFAELHQARNVKPWLGKGRFFGMLMAGADQLLLRGRAPWTLPHRLPDHLHLKALAAVTPIVYPKPDGVISFDRPSSVYLSTTRHDEDQPVHLTLRDAAVPVTVNLARYGAPEQRYCPAGVYEILEESGKPPRLQINAINCLHCKACDIKDPTQNIEWVAPQGGEGPGYANL